MIIYVALAVAVFCLYALWKIVLPAVSNARSGRPDLSKKAQLNVLITGASKGLGFNIAKKFIQLKHNVVICARSKESVENAVIELNKLGGGKAYGTTCDISVEKELLDLAAFAKQNMGEIDLWINNAGSTGYSRKPLVEVSEEKILEIVNTNTIGTLLNAKVAINTLREQKNGGHLIVYFEGQGSNGMATPNNSCYGTTKYGLYQFHKTLLKENESGKVGIHRAQPGMVMTTMLHEAGKDNMKAKKFFNILAEEAEVVADFLVTRMRNLKGTGQYIAYLTPLKVIGRFLTWFQRKNRFYDADGNLKIKLA